MSTQKFFSPPFTPYETPEDMSGSCGEAGREC
jgi:hypothetical protein